MNVWKYEVISRVEQDISLIRFAHLSEISWSTLQINFIFPHIHVIILCIYRCFIHIQININQYSCDSTTQSHASE